MRRSARGGGHEFGRIGVGNAPGVPAHVARYLSGSAGKGAPLDPALRTRFEAAFGHSLTNVRVLSDEAAASAADALNARAMTLGNTIWFGRGEYRPHSASGQRLVAHEVAHTLQQQGAGASLQKELVVGEVGDPTEQAADRAADAVMRGMPARFGAGSPPVVRREPKQSGQSSSQPTCTVTPIANRADQWTVTCGGSSWRVTLVSVETPDPVPATHASAHPHMNNRNMWLDVSVCRGGTDVLITPGADVPAAALHALNSILQGSAALQGVTVTPSLRITVILSDRLRASLSGGVTLGQRGATNVQIGGDVQVGNDVRVGAGGTVDPRNPSRFTVFGTITFTPGNVPHVQCTRQPRQYLVFRCEQITRVPEVPGRPVVAPTTDRQNVYLLFDYAQPTFVLPHDENPDGNPPTRRVQALAAAGYRVKEIHGFTSPEGPLGRRGRFMGNTKLGMARATAARDWLQQVCPECFDAAVMPQADEDPQLYQLHDRRRNEVEGAPLERHAEEQFAGDPLHPSDPARLAGLSARGLRDYVYSALRRARMFFEKTTPGSPAVEGTPAHDVYGGMSVCRPDVETRVCTYMDPTNPACT